MATPNPTEPSGRFLTIIGWVAAPLICALVASVTWQLDSWRKEYFKDVYWETTKQIQYYGRFIQSIVVSNNSTESVGKIVFDLDFDASTDCSGVDFPGVMDWTDAANPAEVLVEADNIVSFSPCQDRGNHVCRVHAEVAKGLSGGSSFSVTIAGFAPKAGRVHDGSISVKYADGGDILRKSQRGFLQRASSSNLIWILAFIVLSLLQIKLVFTLRQLCRKEAGQLRGKLSDANNKLEDRQKTIKALRAGMLAEEEIEEQTEKLGRLQPSRESPEDPPPASSS